VAYLEGGGQPPQHSADLACGKNCLHVLNAAERCEPTEPIGCTSGVSDALELARRTQSPAIMRLMWFHGA
jgi:hypothetical protein